MKTIWKFPIQINDRQVVPMPKGAEILTAQMQGTSLCLWAVVDTDYKHVLKPRLIEVVGTGNPIPDVSRHYIGSVQDRIFVWHVFETLPK